VSREFRLSKQEQQLMKKEGGNRRVAIKNKSGGKNGGYPRIVRGPSKN